MNPYKKVILGARKQFLKLNKEQEKELLRIYKELANKLSRDISDCRGNSNKTYLRKLNNIVKFHMDNLNIELDDTIKNNIETSSQIASEIDLAYYESIDDVKLRSMFSKSVIYASANTVRKMIQGEYYEDGITLDNRIWNITRNNAKDIEALIKINVSKGANAKELAKEVERYVNPFKRLKIRNDYIGFSKNISYQSARLARTSISHSFANTIIENSKRNPFNKGIRWNLSASHSSRMKGRMDICDEYNGRIFKPNEVPLQHPNCLCYFTEENEDIDNVINELKAWSNGEDNSKLDEWMENYKDEFNINKSEDIAKRYLKVNSNDKGDMSKFIKKIFNKSEIKQETITLMKLPKKDLEDISKIVSNAPLQFQQIFLRYSDKIKFLNINSKEIARYNVKHDAISINLKNDSNNVHGKGKYTTIFHEIGHLVDRNMGRPSTNLKLSKNFKNAIIKDVNKFILDTKNSYNINYESELYEFISENLKNTNKYHSISDIFGGVTENKIVGNFKHRREYWQEKGALERETFAHFFEATIRNDNIKLKMFENILPNSYDIFIKLLKEV